MLENLSSIFDDPLVRNAVLSGASLILIYIVVLFLRRLIRPLKMDDQRRERLRQWIGSVGLCSGFFLLVRIWAYAYMLRLFEPEIINRILLSVVVLAFILLFNFLISRILTADAKKSGKLAAYIKWVTLALICFYVLILIRIWAMSNLFDVLNHPLVNKLYKSLIIFGLVYVALLFIHRFINNMKVEITKRHQYRKRASTVVTLVYFLLLIPIWAGSTHQWTTVLSVMGAGIALALHEVLLNITGWLYIVVRRPYKTGDRIEMGSIRGDVIDIRLFQTSLLEVGSWVDGDQSTGRLVHMPHGQIFRNPLYNYTKGFAYLWNEFPILVTFESDWEAAREIMLRCGQEESEAIQGQVQRQIERMAREYLIYFKKFTPIVYTKIEESGVKLTLRYLTGAKSRRTGVDSISCKVLKAIAQEPNVEFAYPTYRIFKQGEEKGGDRPSP